MSEMKQYRVMREHLGDKFYRTGDLRILNSFDARNLVKLGVLVEEGTPLSQPTGATHPLSASPAGQASPEQTSNESDDGDSEQTPRKPWNRKKRGR